MVSRRESGSVGDAAARDAVTSLLLVAAVLLGSVVSLLVLGGLLAVAEISVVVHKAVLLSFILFLAFGQPHFVREMTRRLRMPEGRSRIVSLGTMTSSLVLLALGVLVSRTL